jgi:uncharacterized membrane protein YsdA (DUF1294 family)
MARSSAFGAIATILVLVLFILVRATAPMPVYFAWLVAASLTAFVFYGLDKGLARLSRFNARVPERVLNLLALAGGFPGAWLGRNIWRHKTNVRRHWDMLLILLLSTVLHGALIYRIVRGGY